ncbi:hypothetical protein PaG_01055 [Moesziomyces aphidis]|uniref:DUF4604 domain-containing protein n=1 Tax=Moesziomyces aphidis TaxID=84754 RepID=W3VUT3_MOEAP|nr:hypothetical protein PaG_01055 [Moesziomyces aphidis]
MSGRKGSLASRSLEYRAPEVPSFLKALKAQVSESDRYSRKRPNDELDSLVSSASSASKRKACDEDETGDLDSDDELRGAQVVVLKDGKHLSQQQALEAKADLAQKSPAPSNSSQNIASSASNSSALKRRRQPVTGGAASDSVSTALDPHSLQEGAKRGDTSLDHVKQLIREDRQAKASTNHTPKQDTNTKEGKRKLKNAEARKLKAKSGKGLSFDLDD